MKKRLQSLASMVPQTKRVIDVGADHALLDIYLAKKYLNTSFLAIDISENALKNARKNILISSLETRIKTLLNDGLENIELNDSDFIIISGLGTNTIIKIIEKRVENINNILVQSNKDLELLRKKMIELGFIIYNEKVIFDKTYYVFIHFKKGISTYDKVDFWLGPIIKESNEIEYFKHLFTKYKKILPGIPDNDLKKIEIINRLNYLKMLIEKM